MQQGPALTRPHLDGLDESSQEQTRRTQIHFFRAVAVSLVWVLGCLPLLVGRAGCPFAEIFGIPCPGCGMTRAVLLLSHGEIAASLRMHSLAVPSALSSLAFMAATVWVTAKTGSPEGMWRDRLGRAAVLAFAAIEALVFALWIARMCGFLGGPVPV